MMDATDRTVLGARRGAVFGFGLGLAAALAALATSPAATATADLGAQERRETCRCVDRDGNEIENCRCMRAYGQGDLLAFDGGSFFERRARIGVSISEGQDDQADRQGALVTDVRPGGPADQAGIREGDLVVSVAGRSVFDPLEDDEAERSLDLDRSVPVQRFMRLVGGLEPGEDVEIEILREGRRRTLTVTPEEWTTTWSRSVPMVRLYADSARWRVEPEELQERAEELRRRFEIVEGERPFAYRFNPRGEGRIHLFTDSTGAGERFGNVWASDPCVQMGGSERGSVFYFGGGNCVDGVELIELNPELGEYFGTDEGVLVAEVAEGATLGLRPGDVLLAIDGREVQDAEHARRILSSYRDDEEVRLRIRRHGEDVEVLGTRR